MVQLFCLFFSFVPLLWITNTQNLTSDRMSPLPSQCRKMRLFFVSVLFLLCCYHSFLFSFTFQLKTLLLGALLILTAAKNEEERLFYMLNFLFHCERRRGNFTHHIHCKHLKSFMFILIFYFDPLTLSFSLILYHYIHLHTKETETAWTKVCVYVYFVVHVTLFSSLIKHLLFNS